MEARGFINYNGQLLPADSKLFGADNRAFRYGDGLFESIRLVDGKLMFFKYHMERLFKGMELLHFKIHKAFNPEFLASEIFASLKSNKLYKNARIRLSVFRSEGGLYTPEKNTCAYLIETFELPDSAYVAEKGLIVDVFTGMTKDFSALSALKTMSALPYVMAGVFKLEQGVDECVILNAHGRVVECISSNIFLVKEDKVYTPEIAEGCIDGVMRKVVLELLQRRGITCIESKLPAELLEHADELFICNSIKGIQSVVGFGSKRFFSRISKLILQDLNEVHVEQRNALA